MAKVPAQLRIDPALYERARALVTKLDRPFIWAIERSLEIALPQLEAQASAMEQAVKGVQR